MGIGDGPGRGSRKPKSPEALVSVVLPQIVKISPTRIYEIGSRKRINAERRPINLDVEIHQGHPVFGQDRRIRRAIWNGHRVFQQGIAPDERFFVLKTPKTKPGNLDLLD